MPHRPMNRCGFCRRVSRSCCRRIIRHDSWGAACIGLLGIDIEGGRLGAPSARSVWVYFMTGGGLAVSWRGRAPYLWLTGCQRGSRDAVEIYKAHRQGMRKLFRRCARREMKLVWRYRRWTARR